MEYITVQQAAEKWGVTIQWVQNLCRKGQISGTMRFYRSWAIPNDVEKPKDSRYKANKERQNNIVQSFQSMCGNEELLSKIVEFFPYPIQVSTLDGTLILANKAFLKIFHVASKDKVIGKYNVLQDTVIEKSGLKEHVIRAFQGETVQLFDIKVPIQDLIYKFGKGELGLEIIFQNITSFPIYNDNNQLSYVVTVFMTSRVYRGKEEIIKGKEYIENHRHEEFDVDTVAKASGLSKTQFTRLFKTHTGFTPHDYYVRIKINMIKEKLLDYNLSISQAFTECGVDYNGHYAKIFKDHVGTTPSEYRRNNS
jgi:AraC family transcriptional regulator